LDNNEIIRGIAVDDLTALGIDKNRIGTAFGTGGVAILTTKSKKNMPFNKTSTNQLMADSIKIVQLLNQVKYDFNKDSLILNDTLYTQVSSPANFSTKNRAIYLTTSESNILNTTFLRDFAKEGKFTDRIIIVSSLNDANIRAINRSLTVAGAKFVNIIQTSSTDTSLIKFVNNSYKFIFVNVNKTLLNSYFNNNPVGNVVKQRIEKDFSVLAFMGESARLAGSYMLSDNYKDEYAAYDNLITTSTALGFLNSFLIFPGGLTTIDVKENSSSTLPYFVMKNNLRFGININGESYVKIFVDSSDNKVKIVGGGQSPAMVFENMGSRYGFSTTTSRFLSTQTPRQVAGFDSLYFHFVTKTNPYNTQFELTVSGVDTLALPIPASLKNELTSVSIEVYPNPSSNFISILGLDKDIYQLSIHDILGKEWLQSKNFSGEDTVDISILPKGLYYIRVFNSRYQGICKFIIE
jgi:hypothetical protein